MEGGQVATAAGYGYGGGPSGGRSISDETVALVRDAMADTTRAITTATGFIGYELEAPAKVIVPVITPLVNMLPRRKGSGIDVVHWKAITSFDTARNWGTLADGGTPSSVTYSVAQMQNAIQTIALMNAVSFQAQWRGRSLEADVRARRTAELLYQIKITEERWLLGASAYLMTPPAPVLATAATGGTVAAGTYWVKVTATNAQGQTLGSAVSKITTAGATSTITVTIFTVPNAANYNVYIASGANYPGDAAAWLQAGLSGANAPQPGVGASVTLADGLTVMPSGEVQPAYLVAPVLTAPPATAGTALSTVAANTAKTFVDGSNNVLMWDGIIAQAINNASQGNGATLGAQVAQPAAANGVLALSDIDNLLAAMYLQAAGDPDYIVMNPLDNVKLTNLVIGAGQLRYVVDSQGGDQGDLTAQYRVTRYLNKTSGKEMPIILDRYCPQGHMVFLPMSMPYPVPEVSAAIEIETNQEYWGVDFAITDSNFKFANYVDETPKVYFLGGLGVLRGITPSF
jgi:hypothetical protein